MDGSTGKGGTSLNVSFKEPSSTFLTVVHVEGFEGRLRPCFEEKTYRGKLQSYFSAPIPDKFYRVIVRETIKDGINVVGKSLSSACSRSRVRTIEKGCR